MTARIYKPAQNAMQSGPAKTKEWMVDYEPEQPRVIDPLMGWTSSADMKQELRLHFDTKEEAIAYCERHGIPYQVFETRPSVRQRMSYSEISPIRAARPGRIKTQASAEGLEKSPIALSAPPLTDTSLASVSQEAITPGLLPRLSHNTQNRDRAVRWIGANCDWRRVRTLP